MRAAIEPDLHADTATSAAPVPEAWHANFQEMCGVLEAALPAGAHTRPLSAQPELFCPPYDSTLPMNLPRGCSS